MQVMGHPVHRIAWRISLTGLAVAFVLAGLILLLGAHGDVGQQTALRAAGLPFVALVGFLVWAERDPRLAWTWRKPARGPLP